MRGPRIRRLGLIVALAGAGVAMTACGHDSRASCPGEHCTPELSALHDDVAGWPGVASVELVARDRQLEKGAYGTIKVTAEVTDEASARAVADQLGRLYATAGLDAVRRITVDVSPTPARTVRRVLDTSVSGKVDGDPIPCAAQKCAAEMSAFREDLENDLAGTMSPLESAWVGGESPSTVVKATYSSRLLSRQEALDLARSVLVVADKAGLPKIGSVRLLLTYETNVSYTFVYDGSGVPDSP